MPVGIPPAPPGGECDRRPPYPRSGGPYLPTGLPGGGYRRGDKLRQAPSRSRKSRPGREG